jgi:hypothetical protein
MNMHKPADYLKGEAHPNRVQIGLLWALMIWIFRVAEVAVLAKRENSRRQGAADLVALLGVLAIWLGAHYAGYWETYQHDNFYAVATKALIGMTPDSVSATSGSGSGAGSGSGSQVDHSILADNVSAGLLWGGNLYFLAKQLQRPLLLLLFGDRGLGVEGTMAPSNTGFIIHRINEFMFLMIGEGVLALVTAENDIEYDVSTIWNWTVLTGLGGFIICVAMCVSFREMLVMQEAVNAQLQDNLFEDIEREDRIKALGLDEHDWESPTTKAAKAIQAHYRRWRDSVRPGQVNYKAAALDERHIEMEKRAGSVLYAAAAHDALVTFLWQMNAVATMLVGVGIKLAIYNPQEDGAHPLEQRLQLNVAIVFVFGIQLVHAAFLMDRDLLTLSSLREHPMPIAVFTARFLLLGLGLGLSWLDLSPAENMWGQTASAVAQWALIRAHDSARRKITRQDLNIYFFMPSAFTTLRNKAKRFRNIAGIDRRGHELVHQGTNGARASPDITRRSEQAQGPVIVAL